MVIGNASTNVTTSESEVRSEAIDLGDDCKVEFIQSFCWFYSVPNLLVIKYLETLYLCGIHVRVVCKKV